MAKHKHESLIYNRICFASTLFAGSLSCLTLLSGFILGSPRVSASNSESLNLSVEISAACSLSIAQNPQTVTVNPGGDGVIGTATVKSVCNDPAGLAVYAVGYTSDSYGNNKLSATINGTTYEIPSATNLAPASQWNMTLTQVSGTYAPEIVSGYGSPSVVPDQYTKVAYRNGMTDTGVGATGANFTAAFNAHVSTDQAAGIYTGKVKFLLIHPNVLTWTEDQQNPGTMIPDDVQPSTLACDPEARMLQDVATWGSTVTLGQTVEAVDARDCQTYKVKRLKMNAAGTETALWMSNLNLGAEELIADELNSTNTNLASGASSVAKNTFESWIKTIGTSSWDSPELIPITSSNSDSGLAVDIYNNKYGTLYNFAAASAGTYEYADGSTAGNATSDLCPAGWRLPTGESSGEMKKLINDAYNLVDGNYAVNEADLATIQQNLGFSLAGVFTDEGVFDQGLVGVYWTSTLDARYPVSDMDSFNFAEDWILTTIGSEWRAEGAAIRCIAQ